MDEKKSSFLLIESISSVLEDFCRDVSNESVPISRFHACSVPTISLNHYLHRLQQYLELPTPCWILAFIYVDQLSAQILCSLSAHRLMLTCAMLAAKFHSDDVPDNAYFAKVGGISTKELNQLEIEALWLMKFHLWIDEYDFDEYEQNLWERVPKERPNESHGCG